MYKTIFDLSKENVWSFNLSELIIGICAILIPTAALACWIKFRYVIMGPRTTMYLGAITLDGAAATAYNKYRSTIRNAGILALGIISIMGCLIGIIILGGTFKTSFRYRELLENHSALMVEGNIEQFQPYGSSDQHISDFPDLKTESFRIGNVLFIYSRDFSDGGFQGSLEATNILGDSRVARVSYVKSPNNDKNIILKLEVQ